MFIPHICLWVRRYKFYWFQIRMDVFPFCTTAFQIFDQSLYDSLEPYRQSGHLAPFVMMIGKE